MTTFTTTPANLPNVLADRSARTDITLLSLVLGRDLHLVVCSHKSPHPHHKSDGPIHYELYDADGNYLSTLAVVPERTLFPVSGPTLTAVIDAARAMYPTWVTGVHR